MADTYNPFGTHAIDDNKFFLPPWEDFFQNIGATSSGLSDISASSVTGTDAVVDTIDIGGASGAAFYFYFIGDTSSSRTGFIFVTWLSDGSLPETFSRMDAEQIGDGISVTFSFDYSDPDIRLLATTTGTYTFKAKRLVI